MVKETIIKALSEVSDINESDIKLDIPEREEFGDYTTNVAMVMSKKNNKNPQDLAQEYIQKLLDNHSLMQFVSTIKMAGPGFINFYLKNEYLISEIANIQKSGNEYGKSKLESKKIMFEFGQPNTHKLPHIGHLYSYILGSSMARILEAVGNTLYRANYQGDIGLHVAKCLWAYKKQNPQTPDSLEGRVKLLQEMYQVGSQAFEEDQKTKEEILELNKKIYAHDDSVEDLWKETRSWSVEYYKEFEKRLGVTYDRYYFESEVYDKGVDIVKQNLDKVFKRSEGAIIFEGSKHGLHDRVFVTQYDTATYEAKDMALQILKKIEWPFDLLVITTANEQNEYFKVIFRALEALDPDFGGKLKHLGFGMINLKKGKMSSRTGNIIGGVELIDMAIDEVKKIIKDTKENSDDVAKDIGIGAVKYSFLKNNPLQNMQFDFEESISTQGNSGPYLQYTYARTQSVIGNADRKGDFDYSLEVKLNPEERSIARLLSQFQGVIASAAKNYSPNILCEYLYTLSQAYNTFYNKHKIIGSDKEDLRLALNTATGIVIKNGLKLLGIATPSKM